MAMAARMRLLLVFSCLSLQQLAAAEEQRQQPQQPEQPQQPQQPDEDVWGEHFFKGYVSSKGWLPRKPVIKGPTGSELVGDAELPENFDWRNHGGLNWVTSEVNQHIPVYCGGCWIHGSTLTLNDRFKIYREARFPDVQLSRQALLNCVPGENASAPPPGCNGGDAWMVYKYLTEKKVPDDTCMSYTAVNMGCEDINVCRNCKPKAVKQPDGSTLFVPDTCFPVYNWTGYGVREHGNVSGEAAMMREIFARGPIACGIACDSAFGKPETNPGVISEGVYITDKNFTEDQIDHVMEVTGWGVTPKGTKYWVLRNSWGTYWGDNGWIKVRRGVNQQQLELGCDWAVPEAADIDKKFYEGISMGAYHSKAGSQMAAAQARPEEHAQQLSEQTFRSPMLLTILAAVAMGMAVGQILPSARLLRRDARAQGISQKPLLG